MINELRLPEISENVTTATVIKVLIKTGDIVQKDQTVVEMETEKAALEIPSPVQGTIIEINVKEGDQLNVGQLILKIDTEAKAGVPTPPPAEKTAVKISEEPTEKRGQVQPLDKLGASSARTTAKRSLTVPSSPSPFSLPDFTSWGEVERKPITTTRKKIADTLTYTWSTVPQVTQYTQADITELEEFRKECSTKVSQVGGKLTITSILLKVTAAALKEFPDFNASFDPDTLEIIHKKYCHISVAVDTDRGLLVPVVRDVDKKNIVQLSVELAQLAEKARTHKVTADEMVGGNFTITNLGGIGGTYFAPIIYWPQVAILGVSRAAMQPVYKNEKFEPRLMLPLSLSYDHRVIDGAQGLRFLLWIAESLEKPFLLAFDK